MNDTSIVILAFILPFLLVIQIRFFIKLFRLKKSSENIPTGLLWLSGGLEFLCCCLGTMGDISQIDSGYQEKLLVDRKRMEELQIEKFLSDIEVSHFKEISDETSISIERVEEIIKNNPDFLIENNIVYNKRLLKKSNANSISEGLKKARELVELDEYREEEIKIIKTIPDTKRVNLNWLSANTLIPIERILEILREDPNYQIVDNFIMKKESQVKEEIETSTEPFMNSQKLKEFEQKIAAGICPDCDSYFKAGSDFCPNCGAPLKKF